MDQKFNPELKLEPGLRAYPLQELSDPQDIYDPLFNATYKPPTLEETQARLNEILRLINEQGGQLIGTIDLLVAQELKPNHYPDQIPSRAQTFLIVDTPERIESASLPLDCSITSE